MFKEIGQLAGLMKNLPKMREEMEKLQSQLALVSAEGDAGGGMVKVTVNGKLEVVKCTLSEDALKGGDRELLEDLITAAVNQGLQKAKQAVAEASAQLAGGLGLPSGLGLPG
jgi:DNA-binding YbaB/EbfC family protein